MLLVVGYARIALAINNRGVIGALTKRPRGQKGYVLRDIERLLN